MKFANVTFSVSTEEKAMFLPLNCPADNTHKLYFSEPNHYKKPLYCYSLAGTGAIL